MRWEKANAQFTLTKHHIVSTKQGNSGTHVYDSKLFKKPKNMLGKKILCYRPITQYTDVA